MMKLPNDETPENHLIGDGYLSDEYDQLEMIPAPIRDGDFSEYMWMENEEEFNSQVLRELEEEELMEQCIVAMLDDEEINEEESGIINTNNISRNINDNLNTSVNGLSDSVNNLSLSSNGVRNNFSSDNNDNNYVQNISNRQQRFSVQNRLSAHRTPASNHSPSATNGNEPEEGKSTLNPDAKEFVPLFRTSTEPNPSNENLHS